jgi:hypothetical protein
MGAAQKVVLEQTPCAVAGAAVLHNVIIVYPAMSIGAEGYFMNYNATLCNTAWGKNYWCKSRSVRVIAAITVTVIFLGALGRRGNWNVIVVFITERKRIFI